MMRTKDFNVVLGVHDAASVEDITRAFRRLARKYHPDVSDDPDGERKFKEIAEAYRTLKFAALRSSPDQPLWRSRQFIDASERGYDAWLTWLQFVYWWSGWGAWWSPDILRQERR
jgi:DnaJ-class molecular chaperone with C-terminal Zn finger domain